VLDPRLAVCHQAKLHPRQFPMVAEATAERRPDPQTGHPLKVNNTASRDAANTVNG
jgi:hypothetical protein